MKEPYKIGSIVIWNSLLYDPSKIVSREYRIWKQKWGYKIAAIDPHSCSEPLLSSIENWWADELDCLGTLQQLIL